MDSKFFDSSSSFLKRLRSFGAMGMISLSCSITTSRSACKRDGMISRVKAE